MTKKPTAIVSGGDVWHLMSPDSGDLVARDSVSDDETSLPDLAREIGAAELHAAGITGRGVTVAVIDTGVADMAGLRERVLAHVDLSDDAGDPSRRHRDLFGHGTHMAGIIAGQSPESEPGTSFSGVAPHADVVAVKAGDADGNVTPDQMAAAIDWVVANRFRYGIRVISLSFGVDQLDPSAERVTAAVERAARAGVVVVTSAGNTGRTDQGLTAPASSRYAIAVGAVQAAGSAWEPLPETARGDARRFPDIAAPGKSIVSLRGTGSVGDVAHPEAHVGRHLIKATGSSQAAAAVAGCAALVLQARPDLTPVQVSQVLAAAALPIGHEDRVGAGVVDAAAAVDAASRVSTRLTRVAGVPAPASAPAAETLTDGTSLSSRTSTWAGDSWGATSWGATSWGATSWGATSWGATSWGATSWGATSWGATSWGATSWGATSWGATSWGATSWGATSWGATSWGATSWGATSWGATSWGATSWGATSWGATSWGATSWGATSWGATSWGATSWGATSWGATSWGATSWGATSWGATSWGATSWGATSWGATSWG